jgi:hypothetical protein
LGLSATGPAAAKSLEAALKLRDPQNLYRPDPAPLLHQQLGQIYRTSDPRRAAGQFLAAKRDFEISGQLDDALAALKQAVAVNPKSDPGFVLGDLVAGQNALAGRVPLLMITTRPRVTIQRSPGQSVEAQADAEGYFALSLGRAFQPGEEFTLIAGGDRRTFKVGSTPQLPAETRLFEALDGDTLIEGIAAPGVRQVDVHVTFDRTRCGPNLAKIPRGFAEASVNPERRSFQVSVGHPLLTGETIAVVSRETGKELVHNDVAFSSSAEDSFTMKIIVAGVAETRRRTARYGYEYESAIRRIYRRSNRYLCGNALADPQARVGAQLYFSLLGGPITGTQKGAASFARGSGFSFPLGVYFPIVLSSWEYKNQRYSIFTAPLAEGGIDYFADASKFYHKRPLHFSTGIRLGSLAMARGLDNVLDYVDALAVFSNALRLPTDTPGQSRLAAFLQLRGLFQIPNTPIFFGAELLRGNGLSDNRVYAGVRINLLERTPRARRLLEPSRK